MNILIRILKALTPGILIAIATISMLNAQSICDFPKEKSEFSEAILALQNGHTIHRAGEIKKICKRIVITIGKEKLQYGYIWRDGDFTNGCHFSFEDVLAKDWIIEE